MDQSISSVGKGSPKPRISVTEKKRLLSEWQQSSLKMKEFCEQKGISVSGLKTWIKQFDMGRKRKSGIVKAPSFVALIPEKSTYSTPFAEYLLPDNSVMIRS
ncbi:IS66 family insertion sequence element accessory protein TnpA [Chitinophaga ginsengisoli]|uniref:IS66 family insertion sequence element accessory protein TnpA n=1 Tax=Chitinophaga ginsengisoli TaxID=363837 RepID=UPI000D0D8569